MPTHPDETRETIVKSCESPEVTRNWRRGEALAAYSTSALGDAGLYSEIGSEGIIRMAIFFGLSTPIICTMGFLFLMLRRRAHFQLL